MGGKFVAAIIGVIILVVLAQTFIFGGDDDDPSVTNPGSIPTATPPLEQNPPVLLGEGQGGGGSSGGGSSSGTLITYTVQEGQFLGSIASELGIPPEEQAAWIQEVLDLNDMDDPRQLQAGQELILPARSQTAPSSSSSDNGQNDGPETESTAPPSATGTLPTATAAAGGGGSGGGGVYVVVDGDYPYLIALKHCVDDPDAWVNDMLAINGVDASSLAIGLELDLPAGTPAFCGEPGSGDTSSEEDEDDDGA